MYEKKYWSQNPSHCESSRQERHSSKVVTSESGSDKTTHACLSIVSIFIGVLRAVSLVKDILQHSRATLRNLVVHRTQYIKNTVYSLIFQMIMMFPLTNILLTIFTGFRSYCLCKHSYTCLVK